MGYHLAEAEAAKLKMPIRDCLNVEQVNSCLQVMKDVWPNVQAELDFWLDKQNRMKRGKRCAELSTAATALNS